jgi:hypothetical protein
MEGRKQWHERDRACFNIKKGKEGWKGGVIISMNR